MIDNLTQQQRMVLALVLSLIFFVVYDHFLPRPQRVGLDLNKTEVNNSNNKDAKSITVNDNTNGVAIKRDTNLDKYKHKTVVDIDSSNFHASIDELGRFSLYEVKVDKFKTHDGGYPNLISDKFDLKPLEIRFKDEELNNEAFKAEYISDVKVVKLDGKSKVVTLTQKLSKTTVTKKITFKPDGSYDVDISLSKPYDYFISPGSRPDVASDKFTFSGVLIEKSDGTIDTIADEKAEGDEVYLGSKIVAASEKYYTSSFFDFENGLKVYISKDKDSNPLAFVKASQKQTLHGYIGPKEYDKLKSVNPELTKVIEYGFFTFIAKPVFLFLKYLHSIIGNWGWAIVAITLIIRLLLYPLTFKGMVSMNKLKELSPQIKEIQKKYKSEPQKMHAKTMELYKKHNANPMGGCLPMLIQIPIFFALYRVLQNTIELKNASWIAWYHDLSSMDPYYLLPILMGASMFWQQKITPTNYSDPMQEKIMKFLPLIFTFFFVTFPAGLTLYWFTNNLFTVAQQYYVNSIFNKDKAKAKS